MTLFFPDSLEHRDWYKFHTASLVRAEYNDSSDSDYISRLKVELEVTMEPLRHVTKNGEQQPSHYDHAGSQIGYPWRFESVNVSEISR